MAEREVRAVDGGQPGAGDLVRSRRALLRRGLIAAGTAGAVVFACGLLLPGDQAVHGLAAAAFIAAAASIVAAPLVGSDAKPLPRSLGAACGIAVGLGLAGIFRGEAFGGASAGAAIAGFFLLLAGGSAAAGKWFKAPAPGVAAAAVTGALFLASFHIGDPVLEWGGRGQHSSFALSILHHVNPAGGAVGDGLALDWLRMPIMYNGFPGSVTREISAAQYYEWSYPAWWMTTLWMGGLGLILLVRRR